MKDEDKTKEQLINEPLGLRKRNAELEKAEAKLERLEESLIESEERFHSVAKCANDAIFTINSHGNIVFWNEAAETIFGYSSNEVIQKSFTILIPKRILKMNIDGLKQIVAKGIMSGSGKIVENHMMRKNGEEFLVESSRSSWKTSKGLFITAIIRDITDRKKVEEELIKTKDHLENIIESSIDCIVISDAKGYITRVNKAFLEQLGYNEEEVIGKQMMRLSPRKEGRYESTTGGLVEINQKYFDDAREVTRNRLFKEGKILNWESYYLRKDNKVVPLEENIFYLYNKEGDVTGAVGILRDITERKKAAKEIKEARDFLENIFKTSADGIIVYSQPKRKIIMVNQALEKMLGYTHEELTDKHPMEFLPQGEGYQEKANKFNTELFGEGVATGIEHTWLRKDKQLIDIEISAALLRDNEGTITGAVSTIRDITDRKKYGEALKQSEEKYQNLIENANDAVISIDQEGIIITLNKKAEELYGYTREELLGKSVIMIVTPDRREEQKKALEKLKIMSKIEEFRRTLETRAFGKGGREFPVETSMFGSEIHGEYILTSFIRDITERKEMEKKLLQSEKLKSLGELAGGVAHNFNNVLAAILGRSQLLKRIVDSPPSKKERRKSVLGLKKGLEVIEKASLDGAETVRRIQEFARRRDDDRYFTLVDMTKVIDNALEFTKLRWKNDAESKGIKIKIKKKLSILPSVPGSESELREVITNIINNAIDAMPHGGDITIKTFKKGTHACIKVKDTGMGVPQTMRDRIFDPFFTTKGPQSSGLGMSVSYGIIHRHRGTIMMDSVEGKGSTITIEVPFSEKTVEEIKVKSISSGQKKVNILIIEDEEDVRNLLKDILTHEGHRVETATNGKLGIEKFKKKDFDIVLTDLGMPGMSGWQVAEKIKSINGKVPISLVTGWSIDLKESEMKEKGIDFIIKKPYKLDQLVNVVQEGIILRDQLKAV